MSRIFFFDIDNTLLDHRTRAIPDSALSAIEGLKHAGHTIVVATGRAYEHAKPFIDQVGPAWAITQNGSRILSGTEVVLSVPLPRRRLVALFDWAVARGHHFGINDGTVGYLDIQVPMTDRKSVV